MDGQNDIGYLGWEAGHDITTEEEYQQATEWLANKLLGECTPEHLAVIAAQHMICLDAVKDNLAAVESCNTSLLSLLELAELESASKLSAKEATAVTLFVFKKYKKHRAQQAALASHKIDRSNKERALADWAEAEQSYGARRRFARMHHSKYRVTEEVCYRWLLEASKKPKT